MLTFMDYVARSFGQSTGWNYDNSYSFLTATSDAILSFETPSSATLHASSLSTANFASSYTLSTLGQLEGSISYLYSNIRLNPASSGPSIPLKSLVDGYRDVPLPASLDDVKLSRVDGRKPTLLHATLLLPPPSTLTALYARRVRDDTLLSIFLNSKSVSVSTPGPPPASCLAHVQHDTGRYSIEALASTDSGLLGARGLWNFGIGKKDDKIDSVEDLPGSVDFPFPPETVDGLSSYYRKLTSKPSLLSAGAEFYYSPFSHVIGLSAGMRFTTLATHIRPGRPLAGASAMTLLAPPNIAHSSFPYTMTMTINPIIGALASTYSVRATNNIALSSRFDFNVYSWESRYVLGAEIWRGRGRKQRSRKATIGAEGVTFTDDLAWVDDKLNGWFSPEEQALKERRMNRANENVIKLRVDDGFNIGCLWTGRVKSLIVSAGFSLSPVEASTGLLQRQTFVDEEGRRKRWTGKVGLNIAFST